MTKPPLKPIPQRIRFHMWRSGHFLRSYTDNITIPVWDPAARGVLAECKCGKKWAL